jgi:uncharacterized protein YkwD
MTRSTCMHVLLLTALIATSGCQAIGTFEGEVADKPASTGDESGGASLSPFLVNGQTDHGHPSVGLLQSSVGNCTATLVGSRTVLTAAHCVGYNNRFTVGGRTYNASHIAVHPRCELNGPHPYCSFTNTVEHDIALVILSQAVGNVTPSPIATRNPWVGQQLVLVGFGRTSENGGGLGTKRMGPNRIAGLTTTKLRFDPIAGSSNLCNGDSGGPSFGQGSTGEEVVVGVHSTKNGVCGNGGHDMRVEHYESWLVASGGSDIRLEGQAAPNNPQNPPNPGTPNPPATGNAGEGDSCASQGCLSGLKCTGFKKQDGSSLGKFCLERCSNVGGNDAACDGDEVCTSNGNGGICFASNRPQSGYAHIETNNNNGGGGGGSQPPPAPTATEGQSCKTRGCVPGLHCTTIHTFWGTKRYCMETCSGANDPTCDGGEVCSRAPDNQLVCFLSTAPNSGYTNPGGSSNGGGGGGGGGYGSCTYGGATGVCQSTSQSCNGSYVSGLCPGDNTIKCCVPTSGGGGGSTPPAPAPQSCGSSKETAALNALNAARAQSGKSALSCDSKALAAARTHSADMCANNFSSHTGSNGSTLSNRLHAAGASFSAASQSIAKGFSSGTSMINALMGSSSNSQILLDSRWKRAAIGFQSCGGGNRWTAVVLK